MAEEDLKKPGSVTKNNSEIGGQFCGTFNGNGGKKKKNTKSFYEKVAFSFLEHFLLWS